MRVLGGITLLDTEQTRTAGGAFDGNEVIGVPRTQTNLGVEWDLPFVPHLTLTGRAINTSSQYADAANTQKLPGWTRLDIGAPRTFTVSASLDFKRFQPDRLSRDRGAVGARRPGTLTKNQAASTGGQLMPETL